jgi:hypothetical protein
MPDAAFDTDVLLKTVCYGLAGDIIGITCADGSAHILGAAIFTVRARLKKCALNRQNAVAVAEFEAIVQTASVLEPTEEETLLAAEIEATAQLTSVALDSGESQLAAITVQRTIPILVTGDKRAICAFASIMPTCTQLGALQRRILCLEQLFLRFIKLGHAEEGRKSVCGEPSVDKALSICFGCASAGGSADDWSNGLISYIDHIHRGAPNLLIHCS